VIHPAVTSSRSLLSQRPAPCSSMPRQAADKVEGVADVSALISGVRAGPQASAAVIRPGQAERPVRKTDPLALGRTIMGAR